MLAVGVWLRWSLMTALNRSLPSDKEVKSEEERLKLSYFKVTAYLSLEKVAWKL